MCARYDIERAGPEYHANLASISLRDARVDADSITKYATVLTEASATNEIHNYFQARPEVLDRELLARRAILLAIPLPKIWARLHPAFQSTGNVPEICIRTSSLRAAQQDFCRVMLDLDALLGKKLRGLLLHTTTFGMFSTLSTSEHWTNHVFEGVCPGRWGVRKRRGGVAES